MLLFQLHILHHTLFHIQPKTSVRLQHLLEQVFGGAWKTSRRTQWLMFNIHWHYFACYFRFLLWASWRSRSNVHDNTVSDYFFLRLSLHSTRWCVGLTLKGNIMAAPPANLNGSFDSFIPTAASDLRSISLFLFMFIREGQSCAPNCFDGYLYRLWIGQRIKIQLGFLLQSIQFWKMYRFLFVQSVLAIDSVNRNSRRFRVT